VDSQVLIQLAVNGVIIGGIYALLAIGLSLIFGILGIVNFAHGEFYMLGATATYALVAVLGVGFWPAAAAVVALSAMAGVALYDLFLKRIDRHDFERSILLTVGIAMIVQNGALVLWGADPLFLRVSSLAGSVAVQDVRVPIARLGALFASAAGIAALTCLLHFTRLGQAMRAVAANTAAAAVVGIPAHRIARVTVAVGLAMCGLAGATLAPIYSIHPLMGTLFVFKAFAIVIIGGMGNLLGAGIVAFSLGVLESVLGGYVSLAATEAIVFAAMIAMLLFRPLGLFGRGVRV
jgi:branched-chain amino acid transport system permease protein